jgi:hypothetical protein
MKKFILSVVATGLCVGAAVAGPGGKPTGSSHPSPSSGSHMGTSHIGTSHMGSWSNYKSSSFHNNFGSGFGGKSFSHGFYFPGKSWNHWTYNCWWPKYGCQCYWCPYTSCYYYWCQSASCYYPISYVQSAPPTQVQVQVTNVAPTPAPVSTPAPLLQTQTQTQTQTQGAPPAGIPPLPQ